MVSIGREDMPDKTPEDILKELDSILEKQDTTEGGEASSETKPKAQTQMPTTPKRPTPSTGNMRTMMENTGQAQQVQQQETAARRSAANAEYADMYQPQQPTTPQTPTTNARVAAFQEEQEASARRPDTTPTTGKNTSTNARAEMFDQQQREARAANAIAPNLSDTDNAVTSTDTEQEAVRDNKGAWHIGGPNKPADASTEEDSTGTDTDADVNARVDMFDEEKDVAATRRQRERDARANKATRNHRKREQDPKYDPDYEERDPSDVPQTSENLEGYLTEEEERQQAEANKEARFKRIESGEDIPSWRDIPELSRREYRRQTAEQKEVQAETGPKKTFQERKEENRRERMAKRQKRAEERQEKQQQKVLDERMKTSIGTIDDKDTKKTIEQLTGKRGTGKGWRGTGAGPKINVTTGQQNRDIVQNFITGIGAEQLETEQGKQWLESLKNVKTDEDGTIVIEPDDPALEIWETFAATMPDVERRQYGKNIAFATEDAATTATREAGPGTGTQINSAEPSQERESSREQIEQRRAEKERDAEENEIPSGQPVSSNTEEETVEEETTPRSPTVEEMVLENFWDGGRQSPEGTTSEQEQVLQNYWEGVDEETPAEEVVTQKNFTRTTVRARQDEAVEGLLTSGIINADIKGQLDAVINDAEDKVAARTILESLLLEFGLDTQKWMEWFQDQNQDEHEQLNAYRNALRRQSTAQNAIIGKSADGLVTKSVKNILSKFDAIFNSKVEKSEDTTVPPTFFYEPANSDIQIPDKASHILKGLDSFIEKPPLRLFEKQETATEAAPTSSTGHKGVPGKWSGDHLVPMYRTVHRKKPRELILRAIRWVNPANFFKSTTGKPITELSDDDWRAMDRDELIKNITTLNEYREESLVIANRYDQMISLIEQGQTPYAILWNDPDKWMTLNDRMDRAQRLKKGTGAWEDQLDKTALQLRKILGEEKFNTEEGEKSHFGMIDELFDEDKGRIPFFKDISKKDKPWLRRTRGTGRFGEPEEQRRVISDDAGESVRSARYQLPSRRETLNASESDRQMEIMQQAPIYEGIRLPSEEQLRSEGRFEVSADELGVVDYSSPEESPFLRTVNNPYGQWQEDAGVDATTIRSTRFVAESLGLTRSPEEQQANQQRDEILQTTEIPARQGPVDHSQDNIPEESESIDSAELLELWFESAGDLRVIRLEDESDALFRVPLEPDQAESAGLYFQMDKDRGFGTSPAATPHQADGQTGFIMEDFSSVVDALSLTPEETEQAFANPAYRKSFYKMMLLDAMCGTKSPEAPPNTAVRSEDDYGFDEAASGENQFAPINLENAFALRGEDGERKLFPWDIFQDTGLSGGLAGDAQVGFTESLDVETNPILMPAGYSSDDSVNYEQEIQEVINDFMPEFNEENENFTGFSRDTPEQVTDLWEDFAMRVGTQERYDELKSSITSWMIDNMNQG